jgi:DNA-binding NarL/FixJ family response regulator
MTLRVLVVDDHQLVRRGVVTMLESDPDIDVVGEAKDGQEAVESAILLRPDLVLMDLRMPVMDGVAAIKAILGGAGGTGGAGRPGSGPERENGLPRILVLTTYDTDADIYRALEAGAFGYLLKDIPSQELRDAVWSAAKGEHQVLDETVAQRLDDSPMVDPLTSRELDILRLVAEGKTNAAAGSVLALSEATVKTHLQNVYRKLGVNDRAGMVYEATRRGWLS